MVISYRLTKLAVTRASKGLRDEPTSYAVKSGYEINKIVEIIAYTRNRRLA
jgi:hypothetical protein